MTLSDAKRTLRRGRSILEVRTEGRGRPVLVLGSSVYYPRTFSSALRERCRLIFADLPHFARVDADGPEAAYTLEGYLDDIEAIRSFVGIDRFVLLGHSHHGNIAVEYARRQADRVSHLVLVGTPPADVPTTFSASEQYWQESASQERKAQLKRQRDALDSLPTSRLSEEDAFVAQYVADGPLHWYAPDFNATWLWRDVPIDMAALTAFKSFSTEGYDFPRAAKDLRMPVLAVMGRHDYVVPHTLWNECKATFETLKWSLFERSGHTPQLEEPDRFDALLSDWLD
jgi:proline iminopeptidase